VTGKTVANYESKGDGPPKVKLGRLAGYPKELFIEWLKARLVLA
jgi:predicted DNA-binding transcriptional regulator AlpA